MESDEAANSEVTLADALRALTQERRERELAESRLRTAEERLVHLKAEVERERQHSTSTAGTFEGLMSCLPVAFVVEDSSGIIVWAHPKFCELFHIESESEQLSGMDLWAIEKNACGLFIEPTRYLERLDEIRRAGGSARGDILELSSGSIWVRDCLPAQLGKGAHGWIHVFRDVTEEKANALALKKAEEEAARAERNALRFLAQVSRELRTPLTALVGLLELLRANGGEVSGKEAKGAGVIERLSFNTDLIGSLLDDISTFAQLEDANLRLSEGPVSPVILLLQVKEQMQPLAHDKGLELAVLDGDPLPAAVLGDAAKIRQMLVRLVGNAIKFTSKGTVTLRAFRPSSERPDEITYEVRDTGIGIPEAEQSRVFERYFRGQTDSSGTGIGLSICRDLVHLMGGKIGLESTVGRGTCVYFTLVQPALSDTSPSMLDGQVPRSRLSVPPKDAPKARVLLVEDDPANRRLLTRTLEGGGYLVQAVPSAEEALMAAQQGYFDVIVTDISMSGMDGIQLVRAVRAWERRTCRTPTPAVVVTAHVIGEYQEKCREAGVDVFLGKPINSTALRRALARLCRPPSRVLLVDDSWDERILLDVCLRQYPAPLEIHAANSGVTAVAACKEHEFSLVFIDAHMSEGSPAFEMSSVETLRNIRNTTAYQSIKVVAVTWQTEPEQLEELARRGFDAVLTKPIDRHVVHRVVREALRASVVVAPRASGKIALGAAPTLLQLERVALD